MPWLYGSAGSGLPGPLTGSPGGLLALGSPGCCWVPRSYTVFHAWELSHGAAVGSDSSHGDVVSGPKVDSLTSRPTTIRCLASPGSMTIGATKSGSVRPGSIDEYDLPPSVDTLMPASGSSS